jgi:hypothetical protein
MVFKVGFLHSKDHSNNSFVFSKNLRLLLSFKNMSAAHVVQVSSPRFHSEPSQISEVNAVRKQSILKNKKFWAGLGVVALAAVGIGAAASSSRSSSNSAAHGVSSSNSAASNGLCVVNGTLFAIRGPTGVGCAQITSDGFTRSVTMGSNFVVLSEDTWTAANYEVSFYPSSLVSGGTVCSGANMGSTACSNRDAIPVCDYGLGSFLVSNVPFGVGCIQVGSGTEFYEVVGNEVDFANTFGDDLVNIKFYQKFVNGTQCTTATRVSDITCQGEVSTPEYQG